MSLVCKIHEDGAVMCGVEIELPLPGFIQGPQGIFVWVPVQLDHARAYELASLYVGSIIHLGIPKCLWVSGVL